jgi:type VI secretion system protein ImpA
VIRQEWLQPAANGPACGPNLEYDQDFLALEDASRGRPEQQYGDKIIPATEPVWDDVVERAAALLDRSRDLRIAHLLTRGLVKTRGLIGLRDGLRLVQGLVANLWDSLNPPLQSEDEPDPVVRANSIAVLADSDGLVRDVRQADFLRSPAVTLAVRDVERILDPAGGAAEALLTPAQLRLAIRDSIVADAAAFNEIGESVDAIDQIGRIVAERLDASLTPDLAPLRKVLTAGGRLIAEVRAELDGTPVAADASETAVSVGETAAVLGVGEIRSREDAHRALERVCEFLARNEPTNPAPLLIRRAQRVMTMPFLDIIRELVPEAVGQVENIAGVRQP